MSEKYFDIKCDLEIIRTGGFFCCACVVGKPAEEQSPDPRYCRDCYELLLKEAKLLPVKKRPGWIPKPHQTPQKHQGRDKKLYPIPRGVVLNMSTLESEKTEVDIIQPPTPFRTVMRTDSKRGPKHKQLPQELIIRWANEDMGSKAIATKLKTDYGIKISYKTIQRVIKKEKTDTQGGIKPLVLTGWTGKYS